MTDKIEISANMQTIALDGLQGWDANPRIKTDREAIERLKANLRAGGLLQNLIAVPARDGNYVVIAGQSRLAALQELAEAGEIDADAGIVCAIREIDIHDVEALQVAVAENSIRQQMEPIDEAHAMAQMRRLGRTPAAIAVAFGLSEKVVKQRLALGQLIPEAQQVIRDHVRDLDWGKAMSMADAATQTRIVNDIAVNPKSWADGQEVRRFLTADTIPAEHALFDVAQYQGRIVRDMFEGDKLADREAFWQLQNQAIQAVKTELESAGYQEVLVAHQPVDLYPYQRSDDPAQSIAIIEVLPNGRVTRHTGLVKQDDQPVVEAEAVEHSDTIAAEIAPEGVRMTPAVSEYMAAHRSAMLQTQLSDDFRSCLEITVAGLLGHSGAGIRAQDYRFPGSTSIRTGAAFQAVGAEKQAIQDTLAEHEVNNTGHRDHAILAMVASMDDDALAQLFTRLTAAKVGQQAARVADHDPESLTNTYGQRLQIEVRASWTPDQTFFELMTTQDLVRLGRALLPADRQRGLAGGKRKHIVRVLADTFAAAASNDGTLDRADVQRLNAWVPGGMAFPAHDDILSAEADEGDDNRALEALFAGAA